MDIVRPVERRPRRLLVMALLGVVVVVGATAFASLSPALPAIRRSDARLEQVQRAPLVRDVQARGVLAAEELTWVTADGPARVARIDARAGASLAKGDALCTLENAELELAALEAERAAASARAEITSLEVGSRVALLGDDASLVTLGAESEALGERARTTANLAREGLAPDLERRELEVRAAAMTSRIAIERRRRDALATGSAEEVRAQRAALSKLDEVATFRRGRLSTLRVTAPVAGLVQELRLEPGQWVTAGMVIAKIAKPGRLKAVLQVPEALAGEVMPGQDATVEVAGGRASARVVRIDPAASGGTVSVELAFTGALPDGARADQALNGTIAIERIEDALVVSRPAGVVAGTSAEVFVLDPDGASATRRRVGFGRGSVRQIEVTEGLSEGQSVVFADFGQLGDARRVRLAE